MTKFWQLGGGWTMVNSRCWRTTKKDNSEDVVAGVQVKDSEGVN